jgi:hypothetical protein
MADLDNAPGAGDVELDLGGGEIVTLRCTPAAVLRLSRMYSGLADFDNPNADTVHRRIKRYDPDAMAAVIRAGAAVGSAADPKLPEKVYAFGLYKMSIELDAYLALLLNAGRPISAPAKEGDGEGADPLAPTK